VDTVAVGGLVSFFMSFELRKYWGNIGAVLFSDIGMVWADPSYIGEIPLAPSIGTGFRYNTPVGALRLDVARRLDHIEMFDHEPQYWFHLRSARRSDARGAAMDGVIFSGSWLVVVAPGLRFRLNTARSALREKIVHRQRAARVGCGADRRFPCLAPADRSEGDHVTAANDYPVLSPAIRSASPRVVPQADPILLSLTRPEIHPVHTAITGTCRSSSRRRSRWS
jgi:hypothetical protein